MAQSPTGPTANHLTIRQGKKIPGSKAAIGHYLKQLILLLLTHVMEVRIIRASADPF
jgi:hypothetical protein